MWYGCAFGGEFMNKYRKLMQALAFVSSVWEKNIQKKLHPRSKTEKLKMICSKKWCPFQHGAIFQVFPTFNFRMVVSAMLGSQVAKKYMKPMEAMNCTATKLTASSRPTHFNKACMAFQLSTPKGKFKWFTIWPRIFSPCWNRWNPPKNTYLDFGWFWLNLNGWK